MERTGFRLDPRLVYYMAYETLQALAYSHGKRGRDGEPLGIVHRDVSASNVMLSSAGEVKLFDFGIAKANRRQTQTQAGMVKGNANFMSPEQARGQSVDRRSDLFSAAVVTFYTLTGQALSRRRDHPQPADGAGGGGAGDLQVRSNRQPAAGRSARCWPAPSPWSRVQRYQTAGEFCRAMPAPCHRRQGGAGRDDGPPVPHGDAQGDCLTNRPTDPSAPRPHVDLGYGPSPSPRG